MCSRYHDIAVFCCVAARTFLVFGFFYFFIDSSLFSFLFSLSLSSLYFFPIPIFRSMCMYIYHLWIQGFTPNKPDWLVASTFIIHSIFDFDLLRWL